MGLRVDRQAALGWLGIEGFRPKGRVPFPAGKHDMDGAETGVLAQSDPDSPPVDTVPAADMVEPNETPITPVTSGVPDTRATEEAPTEVAEPVASESESTTGRQADRLSVVADSPHRALAEAIARVAGLACETGKDDDVLMLAGDRWALSTLAGDGQAKRRLWRALVERSRRPRT